MAGDAELGDKHLVADLRFRNTEILRFDGDKVCRVEVYFGWKGPGPSTATTRRSGP